MKMEHLVVGVDECGRGSLYGNVVAGAVVLPAEFPDDTWRQIRDSKKVARGKRERLAAYIKQHAICWGIGEATVEEVDRLNILHATMRAMQRALDAAYKMHPFHEVRVDGCHFTAYMPPGVDQDEVIPHKCIVRGDDTELAIGAASIIAKVYHDDHIQTLLAEHPEHEVYGLKTNMGYGTAVHMRALQEYGPTDFHRKSFAPIAAATHLSSRDPSAL
jgi:ribonuclease HII